ncbi:MAG: DUF1573 domain-containing protein [Planctomycetaceae bacterium]|nr:DUF1573 domain-containing protein [Planctomycetaceae bacterium]
MAASPSASVEATSSGIDHDVVRPLQLRSYGLWTLTFLSLAVLCGFLARRQSQQPEILLHVDSTQANLGAVASHGEFPVTFMLRNNGRLPIEVISVESSCSCTATTLASYRILPGDSVALKAIFSTGENAGSLSTSIAVIFRGQGRSQLYRQWLQVAATVKPT